MHLRSFSEPRLFLPVQQQKDHDQQILLHGSHHVRPDPHGNHYNCAARCRIVLPLEPLHRVSEGLDDQYFY